MERIMRQIPQKTIRFAVAAAVASGVFALGTPSASAVCYPVETQPAGVSPCASFVGNCVNARVYYRAVLSGSVGLAQPVCLP